MDISKFPKPSDYSSWNDYVDATHSWSKATREVAKDTRLPVPLASWVHFPVPPFESVQRGIVKKVVDPTKNPPQPAANLEMIDIVIDEKHFDEVTVDSVPMTRYLAKNAHWGSELIDSEPLPYLYDDFDSYFEAMRAWKEKTKRDFVHPADLRTILDTEFEAPGEILVEKPGTGFLECRRKFDGTPFLEMQDQKEPSKDVMDRLWDACQHPKPIVAGSYSREYRFRGKNDASQLVEMMEKGNSDDTIIDLAKQLEKFKIWADPELDRVVPGVGDRLEIDDDMTPKQVDEAFVGLDDPQVWIYNRQQHLCFLLSQLHTVKSSRFRARVFTFMHRLLTLKPSLTISLFFWSHETLCNVAKLFADFSNDYNAVQPCRTFNCLCKYVQLKTLFALLAGRQLLSILSDQFPKKKAVRQEIDTRNAMHKQEIKSHMAEHASTFETFFRTSQTFEEAELQFQIVELILECDFTLIDYIFNQDHDFPIWLWLGRMKSSPETALFYGNISCHILRRPDLRAFFAQHYFAHNTVAPLNNQLLMLSQCSRLIAVLIKSQFQYRIEWDVCNSMLLRALQLIEYNPLHVIELIGAICFYYSWQVGAKAKAYISRFGEFRISVLNVFVAAEFTVRQLCVLLRAMSPLLREEKDLSTAFAVSFLPIITEYMGSHEVELVRAAWIAFRRWYEDDGSVEIVLMEDDEMKQRLITAVQLANMSDEGRAQIAILIQNPVKHRKSRRRKKDAGDPLTQILQKYSFALSSSASLQRFLSGRNRSTSRRDPRRRSLTPR